MRRMLIPVLVWIRMRVGLGLGREVQGWVTPRTWRKGGSFLPWDCGWTRAPHHRRPYCPESSQGNIVTRRKKRILFCPQLCSNCSPIKSNSPHYTSQRFWDVCQKEVITLRWVEFVFLINRILCNGVKLNVLSTVLVLVQCVNFHRSHSIGM